MTETVRIPKPLNDLFCRIEEVCTPEQVGLLKDYIQAATEDAARKTQLMETVRESLSTIRMDVKYLMFDLEATRRERNEALKRL